MAFFGKYYFAYSRHGCEPDAAEGMTRFGNDTGDAWQPLADVYETDDGVVVLMEVAGVGVSDINIQVNRDMLLVGGRRREGCPRGKKRYCQMEIHHGQFERALPLPCPVDAKNAHAVLHNGMLDIYLPRARAHGSTVAVLRVQFVTPVEESE